jgi:hypothetical protein
MYSRVCAWGSVGLRSGVLSGEGYRRRSRQSLRGYHLLSIPFDIAKREVSQFAVIHDAKRMPPSARHASGHGGILVFLDIVRGAGQTVGETKVEFLKEQREAQRPLRQAAGLSFFTVSNPVALPGPRDIKPSGTAHIPPNQFDLSIAQRSVRHAVRRLVCLRCRVAALRFHQ